jgi:putative DNA primase/helicase
MTIDFKRISSDALPYMQSICERILPGGKIRNNEYVVRNPKRKDDEAGSFTINLTTGIWKDFATGDAGHDVISLYAFVSDCGQGKAAREIATLIGQYEPVPLPAEPYDESQMERVSPVPDDAPAVPPERAVNLKNKDWVRYPITHYWEYRDRLGNTIGYVVRYETPTGKETPMMTLWRNKSTGAMKWRFKGFLKPRPLYNLNKIANTPSPLVIIVEGEKCAELLQQRLSPVASNIVVTTWPGGAQAFVYADLSPVEHASQILYWPDNTAQKDPGYKTMLQVAGVVAAVRAGIPSKIIRRQPTRPDGWDCADAILEETWDADRLFAFIKSESEALPADLPQPRSPRASGAHGSKPLPEPGQDTRTTPEPFSDVPFRVLGQDADFIYFYPSRTNQVKKIRDSDLIKKAFLYTLAQPQFWERNFRGERGPSWDMASDWILQNARKIGTFDIKSVRGRGVWDDAGRQVVNLGNNLMVNGEISGFNDLQSKFVYQSGPTLEFDTAEPLRDREGLALLDICKDLHWEQELYATLLAGWCVIAPICGGLSTRPHVWLTGGSGTGKTVVINMIVKQCLGDICLPTTSDTSEAGIRQSLKYDALPVLIDEFESDGPDDLARVEKILALARQAFSGDAPIIKGGAHGTSQTYLVRSCFFMSSINVSVSQRSDKTRIMILRLTEPRPRDGLSPKEQWEALREKIISTITPAWCARLRARSISLISVINQNAAIFADAVASVLGSSRTGDQLGPVLAGVYSLQSSAVITRESAMKWVKSQQWEDQQEIDAAGERDEMRCLRTIFGTAIYTRQGEVCLSDVIERLLAPDAWNSCDDDRKLLAIYGCKLSVDREFVFVAKEHTQIKRMLERTPWKLSYFELLKRLVTTPKTSTQKMNNMNRTCVNIPIRVIIG